VLSGLGRFRPQSMSVVAMADRPRISDRARKRLFELHKGLCHLCMTPINPLIESWQIEHIIPRWTFRNPSEADTDENMQPAHSRCHKLKTIEEAGHRAKAVRREARAMGAHRSKSPLPAGRDSRLKRKMDGTVVDRYTGEIIRRWK
jgi:5-methylcytosine-specific restriction protein A